VLAVGRKPACATITLLRDERAVWLKENRGFRIMPS
jgi:hypothetical protein